MALRAVLIGLVTLGACLVVAPMVYVRTPWNTLDQVTIAQPVEFDHRHHAADDGIDCVYCHWGAEKSAVAGIPATEVCMGCHGQIWRGSPLLETVRRSYFSGTPIAWNRVHDLPDFVYFHHGVHVSAGIECTACHGRVDRMARVRRVHAMTMGWCLQCHRRGERRVTRLTTCSACHR